MITSVAGADIGADGKIPSLLRRDGGILAAN
jgi:hypothetical protein